ncbi:MAG: GNAT family N-acetyltransferase [Prevotella sp.]|jgi:L-amino acid N-acyltransferase YncA|nr:GNAT family N-acetyltransferase [Prevotella sp.]
MNLKIRKATVEDAERLLEIYAPYVLHTAITFEYEVPSLAEFRQRIADTSSRFPYLVAEENGVIEGYAYADKFQERAAYSWAVEMTVYVDKNRRRGGVGKALYEALEAALKVQGILNLNACIAYTETPDEHLTLDSVRFHEHLGYQKVAHFHQCGYKFGHWYDMIWMEKLIGEHKEKRTE